MFSNIDMQIIHNLSIQMAMPSAVALLVIVLTHLSIIFQNNKFNRSDDVDLDSERNELPNYAVNWSLFSGIILWIYVFVGVIVISQPSVLTYCLIPLVSMAILIAIIFGRETIHDIDRSCQIRKLASIDLVLLVVLIIISFFQRSDLATVSSSLGILITFILGGKIFIDLFQCKVNDSAARRAKTGLFLGYAFLILGLIITYIS